MARRYLRCFSAHETGRRSRRQQVRVPKCVFRSGLGRPASLGRCFGIKVALLPVTRNSPVRYRLYSFPRPVLLVQQSLYPHLPFLIPSLPNITLQSSSMTTLAVDKNASSAIDENDFDDEHGEHGEHHPHRNSVHHKLRASSSIMQLKKLLGTLPRHSMAPVELPDPSNSSPSRQPRRNPHPNLPYRPRAVAAHSRSLQS